MGSPCGRSQQSMTWTECAMHCPNKNAFVLVPQRVQIECFFFLILNHPTTFRPTWTLKSDLTGLKSDCHSFAFLRESQWQPNAQELFHIWIRMHQRHQAQCLSQSNSRRQMS